jgi:hypothetical protein
MYKKIEKTCEKTYKNSKPSPPKTEKLRKIKRNTHVTTTKLQDYETFFQTFVSHNDLAKKKKRKKTKHLKMNINHHDENTVKKNDGSENGCKIPKPQSKRSFSATK